MRIEKEEGKQGEGYSVRIEARGSELKDFRGSGSMGVNFHGN